MVIAGFLTGFFILFLLFGLYKDKITQYQQDLLSYFHYILT